MNEHVVEEFYSLLADENKKGWRFMTCPASNLKGSPNAIITLNPGGICQPPPSWSMENGISYFEDDDWRDCYGSSRKVYGAGKDLLQQQVQYMARELNWDLRSTFSAQFVPFCSPNWAGLKNKREILEFCRSRLWDWALNVSPARKIICIGSLVTEEISKLENAVKTHELPTGWSKRKMVRLRSSKTPNRIILGLPHLSTYKIFNRAGRPAEMALKLLSELQDD